jgi:hypothetical protein
MIVTEKKGEKGGFKKTETHTEPTVVAVTLKTNLKLAKFHSKAENYGLASFFHKLIWSSSSLQNHLEKNTLLKEPLPH